MEDVIIPLASIFLSGVASVFISQCYGRKNLKTSQYVTIITSERIKWIEKVREEFAELLSSVILYLLNSHIVVNYDKPHISQDMSNEIDEDVLEGIYNDQLDNIRYSNIVKLEMDSALTKREIVERAILLKLKLNPQEDSEILSILDDIIRAFSMVTFYLGNQNIEYDKLSNKCQEMLKREWEKVKSETQNK